MFTHFSYFFRDVFHKTPGDGASFEALDSTLSALKRESENDHRKSNILQKTYKIFFVIIKRSMDKNGKMRLKVKKNKNSDHFKLYLICNTSISREEENKTFRYFKYWV